MLSREQIERIRSEATLGHDWGFRSGATSDAKLAEIRVSLSASVHILLAELQARDRRIKSLRANLAKSRKERDRWRRWTSRQAESGVGRHIAAPVPAPLRPFADQLHEILAQDVPPPCVYFLVNDGALVYIGQSLNLSSRLETHQRMHRFDRVLYLPVPESMLEEVEGVLIRALRPRLNGNPGLQCAVERRAEILRQLGIANETNLGGDRYGS